MNRLAGRKNDELRQTKAAFNYLEHLPGSVLFQMGKTKVLCTVTLQNTVPPYVKGKQHGWLTAEYALMPNSTHIRTQRESTAMKRSGRSVEISRFISRTLRTIVDLYALGERTLMIDCDVVQADGGTRTTAITGACLALAKAQNAWLEKGLIVRPFLKHKIAAVSVSINNNIALLDPNYKEDSQCQADFNFVLTNKNSVVEIQGGAEKNPVKQELFLQAFQAAQKGVADLFIFMDTHVTFKLADKDAQKIVASYPKKKKEKVPLFSLINRQTAVSSTT